MADDNQNTLSNQTIPTDHGGPTILSNGKTPPIALPESDSLKTMDSVLFDDQQGESSLKVVPLEDEESALMAELKKPQPNQKKVVFDENPELKDEDDDMEEEDYAMVIDEQEEDSKTSQDVDMAEEIDHLDLKPVIVTDQTRKESFLSCLGLVTKEALSELQNKKYTRKRRSTANPHFSNAAIEAKRINQMELAAKKARRKEQMAELRSNKPARMSLYRQPDRHLKTLSPSETNKDKMSSSLLAAKKPSSDPVLKISCDCFVCSENCDTELDVILFCRDCKCLFHATCASTLEAIISSGFVPCPKCDNKRTMEDELTSNEQVAAKVAKSQPKRQPPIIASTSKAQPVFGHKVKADGTKTLKPAKKLKTERNSATSSASLAEMMSSNRENGDPKKEERKIHHEAKRKELESLMERKYELEKEWNDRKKRLEGIQSALKAIRDKSTKLENDRKIVNDDIEKLVGFIKSVQIYKDIIDSDEAISKQKQQSSMTITTVNSIPAPISNAISMSSNGQPITLNVPMVVTTNGQQIISSNVAPADKGPPVISATISSIGNKIISINSKPMVSKAGPITAPQVVPKVFSATPVPVNSSNGAIGTTTIMLQRVSDLGPQTMSVRNVSPGWVTVPVTSLTGGKIIVPRIITSVGGIRPAESAKTQVDMHRAKKPFMNPSNPYIQMVKPTISSPSNMKTYSLRSTVPPGSTVSTVEHVQMRVGSQVENEFNNVINLAPDSMMSTHEVQEVIIESVGLQSEVDAAIASIPNDVSSLAV